MKKVLLSGLVSIVCTGHILASTHCAAFNGFYLGAGLDYIREKFKINTTVASVFFNKSESGSVSLRGGGIKLFGGYGLLVSQGFYLGGEFSLGVDRITGSRNSQGLNSNNRLNYGVAARLGYTFSNVLPYIKFGYEGRHTIKFSDVVSIHRNGVILGSGLDVAVTRNVFIRGEYVHGFGSRTNNSFSKTIGGGININANLNFKTSSDTFLLGAAYKF